MSYARKGSFGSDVYVIADIWGKYECLGCDLMEDLGIFVCEGPEEMVSHLKEHVVAGYAVADRTFIRLQGEYGG